MDRSQDDPDRPDRYERGLDDYHDPTAGVGGAPPAHSALTLRLWLAVFGLTLFTVVAVTAGQAGLIWLLVLSAVLAVAALANLLWILRRKRRGEPG